MGAKAIARFVVIVPAAIVVEHPTRMLTAAGFVKKDAVLVGFTLPESSHLALFAMGLPCAGIDMTARIERRNKFVSMEGRAGWIILGSGQMKYDAL